LADHIPSIAWHRETGATSDATRQRRCVPRSSSIRARRRKFRAASLTCWWRNGSAAGRASLISHLRSMASGLLHCDLGKRAKGSAENNCGLDPQLLSVAFEARVPTHRHKVTRLH